MIKKLTHYFKYVFVILVITSLNYSCKTVQPKNETTTELAELRAEIDQLNKTITEAQQNTTGKIATFLTFQKGNAEEAMNFYMSLFENTELINVKRWGPDGPSEEGTIMHATFTLDGKLFMCSDSPPIHEWDFTPAVSNYVECDSESELESLFTQLSQDGTVMMPLNNYGFSKKFGFVVDRFGVSWQLNLK